MKLQKWTSRWPFRPLTMLIITAIFFLIFLFFALFEYRQSRSNLLVMMKEEGYVLMDALLASGERSVLVYDALEVRIRQHLFQSAFVLETVDAMRNLDGRRIRTFADLLDLYHVHVLDQQGDQVLGNAPSGSGEEHGDAHCNYRESVAPILRGEADSLLLGFLGAGNDGEDRYAVAVRRRRGGAIVVSADAKQLIDIRRNYGPGRLIQEIGRRAGVVYMVLQDTLGIIMASPGVTAMNRIDEDSFLHHALTGGSENSRIYRFGNRVVFELVAPFEVNGVLLGLYRVGLDMSHYFRISRNAKVRLFLTGFLAIILGLGGVHFLIIHQNARLLSQSYQRVQTHTGTILQNLEDAVIAADQNRKITVVNRSAEKLFHIRALHMTARDLGSIRYPFARILEKAMDSGKSDPPVEMKLDIGGETKSVVIRTSVILNRNMVPDTAILVATDVTAQRRLEEQVIRQDKLSAMGELASGVAHEIRNPINAIGMIAQRFLKEFHPEENEEEYRTMAATVHSEVKRINGIVGQFLQFARPPKLHIRSVDIIPFIRNIQELFSSSAQTRGVQFRLGTLDPAVIPMDTDQMKQVFLNLLQNSLDATPPGGVIEMYGRNRKTGYVIDVKDTGSGIPAERLKQIFNLYYTTKPDGTGLGLPLANQIIQGHGGKIFVESREGKGTTVSVTLPPEKTGTGVIS